MAFGIPLAAANTSTEGASQSPLAIADLDPAAFSGATFDSKSGLGQPIPQQVLWTSNSRPEWSGVTFGDSATPGPRHLRIGFNRAVAAGAVIVRGGGALSVLKPSAPYPGDVNEESDWAPAERLRGTKATRDEVGRTELAIWTLPPQTTTRALRFTHRAAPQDSAYGGWLGGALVLANRMVNVAPQAFVTARARTEDAQKITNGEDDGWEAWDNGSTGARQPVSPQNPEWLMLVWPKPVPLSGLETLWTGFGAAEVQTYTGPQDASPLEAEPASWKTILHAGSLQNGYPLQLWPNPLLFDRPVTTRALRIQLTAVTGETHAHLLQRTCGGRRVWLGELMALQSVGEGSLASAVIPLPPAAKPPPIPVHFTLKTPGYVTLVIDDASGTRVRNLVSETYFPAGKNVAWWDGTDDAIRDLDAAHHGLYHIPARPVSPGNYKVRGLVHNPLDLRYEFSINNPGHPPWETADTSGGWLTNHTPPMAALFMPEDRTPNGVAMVYLGSAISEGGAGLAWVDLDGKKRGGRGWIGGAWTAAPTLARDDGADAVPGVFAYVGAAWTASPDNTDQTHGELRITALTAKDDRAVITYPFTPAPPSPSAVSAPVDWISQLGGIAVRNGLLVASLPSLGQLVFIDAGQGRATGTVSVPDPRGVAFDRGGRLLVLSGKKLLRYPLDPATPAKLAQAETLVATGLEDPRGLALDDAGNIFVSDQGNSNQVKIFSPSGKPLRVIGVAGPVATGRYNPRHMNHPRGLTIDGHGRLWVTEDDFQPKRVSVWSPEGDLIRAFYGPARYGGGGTLDPRDRTRFYYDGMEFRLDWETGTSEPAAIFYRPGKDDLSGQIGIASPETPLYRGNRQYLTNCFNGNPTNGAGIASIWRWRNHVAKPVASLGRADQWPLLATRPFRSCWPAGIRPAGNGPENAAIFAWSDGNDDALVEPNEVKMWPGAGGGVTVMPDLSFLESRVGNETIRFAPARFTKGGSPIYDLAAGERLASGAQDPTTTGGDQVLRAQNGWSVLTVAPKPWAPEGFGGVRNGKPRWSYPSLWPGLHASHEAPVPDRPGEVIGSTRLLGGFVNAPEPSDAGPLWAVNGNMGNVYLFTADGLFVARLFEDARKGQPWTMPAALRDTKLNTLSLGQENFFPSITQLTDGRIYLCDGSRQSLVRLDGLKSLRRLPEKDLTVTPEQLAAAASWRERAEVDRQAANGAQVVLRVPLEAHPPVVDGKDDDWAEADWVTIDRRGTAANFDSRSQPYEVTAALAVSGGRLYAAFRTREPNLLDNSGALPNAPFKTGGGLDLMVGADPSARADREKPAPGDKRLFVTLVDGRPFARLYRAVVPGTNHPVKFSSPARTITFDRVEDVSAEVQLASQITPAGPAGGPQAFYEFSIPLKTLGLEPAAGQTLRGDIGILRGDGFQTLQRVYWNNKATATTSDVPSEAELTPALWGGWRFGE